MANEDATDRDLDAKLLEAFFESSAACIVFLDRDFNFVRVNAAYAEACRRPIGDFVGRNHFDLYPSDAKEIFERAVATKQPVHVFARPFVFAEDPSRGVTYWDWTLVPILDDAGDVTRLVFVLADVTERERAVAELQASREHAQRTEALEAVARLAAGVAHDLNNLLTIVSSHAHVLAAGVDPKLAADVAGIRAAVDGAARLTRQLLAIGREQTMVRDEVDLNAIVERLQTSVARVANADVRLHLALEPSLGRIHGDAGMIEQVLLNLLLNARDAMPTGGDLTIATANVTVRAANGQEYPGLAPGSWVRLQVTDTGMGMDAVTAARIFEPFFTTKSGGTGLGLAQAYGIVKQSGGEITVFSEPGRGTTFSMYLPRRATEPPARG